MNIKDITAVHKCNNCGHETDLIGRYYIDSPVGGYGEYGHYEFEDTPCVCEECGVNDEEGKVFVTEDL